MTTGLAPDDPAFAQRWEDFLRHVGSLFGPDQGSPPGAGM
jgi:hypothetical protein